MNQDISFAPQLFIPAGTFDISFYEKAFGAVVLRRFDNADGSIHVAELSIQGALFHLHETSSHKKYLAPAVCGAITTLIGLFVTDADQLMEQALQAGAELIHMPQSFDYGYRQGELRDPFGHAWMLQQRC
ncbi:MAG TPA: VOC family protein [Sediminibacterium sp.]|nr:VOC family protein [Sediminibacterium sp.]